MTPAIDVRGLGKRYGEVVAVENLDLRVAPGEIYGFLGLNGAGKTTTIRLLLGMLRPSAGSVSLLGERVLPGGRGPWSRVGHLVEAPSAYPELTVRENLRIAARLHGLSGSKPVERAVERVALSPYVDRRAGTLSTGNLQRLGLARALLHDPPLLVLDEPANGLDPAGVVEIRELLRRLAGEDGVTIFMSSHILSEVHRLATRIGVIHRGRLVEERDAAGMELRLTRRLRVDARDRPAARVALESAGFAVASDTTGMLLLEEARALEAPDLVAGLLVAAGAPPILLVPEQEELEEHFLRLTGAR